MDEDWPGDLLRLWWACSDLNREPKDYESSALTIELQARSRRVSTNSSDYQ